MNEIRDIASPSTFLDPEFQHLMGATFNPRTSNVVDSFVYKVLQAADQGDLNTFIPLCTTLNYASPENRIAILKTARKLANLCKHETFLIPLPDNDDTQAHFDIEKETQHLFVKQLVATNYKNKFLLLAASLPLLFAFTLYKFPPQFMGRFVSMTGADGPEEEILKDKGIQFDKKLFFDGALPIVILGAGMIAGGLGIAHAIHRETNRVFAEFKKRETNHHFKDVCAQFYKRFPSGCVLIDSAR